MVPPPTIAAAARTPVCGLLFALLAACGQGGFAPDFWTPMEREAIESMWIERLPPLPPSPGNPVADDPRAVELGHWLFFDPRLSANGAVACATCHQPTRNFKDGLGRSQGIGQTARKSMSVVGSAYSPWLFWDGRRDSLWAQALEPLEDPVEHGISRVDVARLIVSDADYRRAYQDLFGDLPNAATHANQPEADPTAIFANVGRALEAYQRQLLPGPAPFDAFAEALLANDQARANTHLTPDQRQGLKLFLGRANCIHCHNGPLLTNHEFHNTGLEGPGGLPKDRGRVEGVQMLLADPFNCLGPYSGARREDCAELRFVKTEGEELVGAFRTVSLRNIADTGPYMHTGQFATLTDVIDHYNLAQPTLVSDDLQPLRLTAGQVQQIVVFLDALSAPLRTSVHLLRHPIPIE